MKTNKNSKNTLEVGLILLGIAVILSFGVSSVAAATTNSSTIFVNTHGNDSWDGQLAVWNGTSGPKRTIASATSAVYPNGTVYIDNGTYNESDIPLLWNMKIIGDDQNDTVIDAQGRGSIFTIMPGANVTIANLKLTNGNSSLPRYGGIYGGAICNFGNLNVTDCTFTNNTAQNINFLSNLCGDGGAIYNRGGTLTVTNSTFTNNTAQNSRINAFWCGDGGAIYNDAGTLTVTNSTFTNNTAQNSGITSHLCGDGGAIYSHGGTLTVTNSTFTNNTAQNIVIAWDCGCGGAIYDDGTVLNANDNWWGSNRGPSYNPQFPNSIYGLVVNNWLFSPPASVLDVRVATDSVHNFTGQNVNLTAHVTDYNGNPVNGGQVTFTVGNATLDPVPVLGGLATLIWQIPLNWSVGSYNLIANFNGPNYYNSLKAGILTVDPPIPTNITVTSVDNYAGQNVTITANITDYYGNLVNEGRVTFTVNHDGTIVNAGTASINNGRVSLNWTIPSNWNIGSYTITATFDGNGTNYTNSTNSSVLTVDKTPTTVTVDPAENYAGQTVTLTAHVNAGGSPIGDMGIVIFIIDGNTSHGECIQPLNTEGVATCIWTIPSDWTAGNYNITAIFNGRVINYLPSTGTGILTVDKTPTNLIVSNAGDFWHQYVDIAANLTDYYGNPLNGENITFIIAGDPNTYNAVTGANGLATLHYQIVQNAGIYAINATFGGDDNYLASLTSLNGNLTVKPTPTNVTINNITGVNNQTVTLNATLTDIYGNPLTNQTVNFNTNGNSIGNATTNNNGIATIQYTPTSAGNHIITVNYHGNQDYVTSQCTGTLTVKTAAYLYLNYTIPNNPTTGETFTITYKLSNKGPDNANNVTVSFQIPEGLEFVGASVDSGNWTYNKANRTITWTLSNVAVGDPYLYLQVKPLNAGSFTINPTIISMTFNQNTQKIPSLIINAVNPPVNNGSGLSNGSSVTVKAANKITMQDTGLPLNYLILAIMMVISGLITSKKF